MKWRLFALVLLVAIPTCRSQFSATLTATPEDIETGFNPTPVLTLSCDYGGPFTINRMLISHFKDQGPVLYATANLNDNPNIRLETLVPDGTSASIDQNHLGIRSFQVFIPNPDERSTGQYVCEAFIQTQSTTYRLSSFATVEQLPFDFSDLVEKFHEIEGNLTDIRAQIGQGTGSGENTTALRNEMDLLREENRNLTQELYYLRVIVSKLTQHVELLKDLANETDVELQSFKEDLVSKCERIERLENGARLDKCQFTRDISKITSLSNSLYIQSQSFNGTRYVLSQFSPASFYTAGIACDELGGGLARMNDPDEREFVETFLKGVISPDQHVLIGSVQVDGRIERGDEVIGQLFPHIRLGRLPNDTSENCVALVARLCEGNYEIRMEPVSCRYNSQDRHEVWVSSFLCKVPYTPVADCVGTTPPPPPSATNGTRDMLEG